MSMATLIERILVPTDFSGASDAALECARQIATQLGASLHLVHVVGDQPLEAVTDVQAGLNKSATGTASTAVVSGETATAIVDHAAGMNADLIVMGTHGRTGLAHLLIGSVSGIVARTAPCPVLTVREPADLRPPMVADESAAA
jgi:nucleotide-binding universal stress UspA family protein